MDKKEVKIWRDEYAKPLLQKYNLWGDESNKSDKWMYVWAAISILGLIVVVFLVLGGHLKSEVSNNISITPNNTVQNSYQFNPNTQNQYSNSFSPNYTINVNIPDNLCNCGGNSS